MGLIEDVGSGDRREGAVRSMRSADTPVSRRPSPASAQPRYDADGNLTGITSADGSLGLSGAPAPTSVTWNGPVTGTVTIGRNALFQATSYSVGGQQITRDVDADGVVSRVGALTIDRSDAGFVQGTTLGGPVVGGGVSVTDTVTPNELGEPLHYVATLQPGDGSAATGVEDVTYTRDTAGGSRR